MEDEHKKYILIGLVFFISGISIGSIMAHEADQRVVVCPPCPSDTLHACNKGCYLALDSLTAQGETVESKYPMLYAACQYRCNQRYGL